MSCVSMGLEEECPKRYMAMTILAGLSMIKTGQWPVSWDYVALPQAMRSHKFRRCLRVKSVPNARFLD